MVDTNLCSAAFCAARALELFDPRRGGELVVVSSVSGDRGRARNHFYGATRAGLDCFLEGLRQAGRGQRRARLPARLAGGGLARRLRGALSAALRELRVRPGDLRIADEAAPGVRVEVLSVQKTGPIVRAEARVKGSPRLLTVEVPHLHHDAASFRPGAELRLRVSRFSVYAASGSADPDAAPSDAIGVAATRSRSRDAAGAGATR